jgi:hypothetical protein
MSKSSVVVRCSAIRRFGCGNVNSHWPTVYFATLRQTVWRRSSSSQALREDETSCDTKRGRHVLFSRSNPSPQRKISCSEKLAWCLKPSRNGYWLTLMACIYAYGVPSDVAYLAHFISTPPTRLLRREADAVTSNKCGMSNERTCSRTIDRLFALKERTDVS